MKHAQIRKRTETELKALTVAIDSYKDKKGFLPPDNAANPAQPPLFYELTGTVQNRDGEYVSTVASADPPLKSPQVKAAFGIDGFLNTAPEAEKDDVDNFYRTLKPNQYQNVGNGNVKFLVAPYYGANKETVTWSYNKTSPTRNVGPGNYDLWAEIYIAGKKEIIGNWKD